VYWFPTYSRADDSLHFISGDVRVREIVKYSNYQRFGSKVKITYEGQELPGKDKNQQDQQQGQNRGQQPPAQQPQPTAPQK